MAFRTNKMPAIEERTVSGSSVSFNSAFALLLKACKVSFSATQAGSGDPSPSNPRAISGVSAIGLNANSTPVSVSLGDTRYGGVLDVLTGELTVTWAEVDLGSLNWSYSLAYTNFSADVDNMKQPASVSERITGFLCEIYKPSSTGSYSNMDDLAAIRYIGKIWIKDTNYTDVTIFKASVANKMLAYELAEPITIQLSANELSSILGNNTFFTDTGTLEITFSDLQEKSASGSVATFNTALAMPLVNGEFTIEAYQEGSGDPSPSNVRAIHGFSEVNVTKLGKNLANIAQETEKRKNGEFLFTLVYEGSKVTIETSTTASLYVVWGLFQIPKSLVGATVTISNSGDGVLYLCRTPNADYSGTITDLTSRTIKTYTFSDSDVGGYLGIRFINATGSDKYVENVQLEVGSTATSYEPYVPPEVKTKQLGETVYGGSYNSVSGKRLLSFLGKKIKDLSWTYNTTFSRFVTTTDKDNRLRPSSNLIPPEGFMCECYKPSGATSSGAVTNTIGVLAGTGEIVVYDYAYTDVNTFVEAMGDYTIKWKLIESIESNIGETPISTNIGDNNIFCDTGDTSLVYKDLDIAKRGNFREVFKLPS